jgi:hypothetical protein
VGLNQGLKKRGLVKVIIKKGGVVVFFKGKKGKRAGEKGRAGAR